MRASARHIAIALAAAALLAGCNKGAGSADASSGGDPKLASEMTMGNPAAKATMVEYASDTCSHCAHFAETVFPAIKAKYIDTGKVYYKFREFLTPPEPVAAAGFLLARCAGKDKYFQVVDAEFRGQEQMFKTGDAHGVLLNIAKSVGMTEPQFDACVKDEKALQALQSRVQRAIDVDKIDGTPTFIINGKQLPAGEKDLADFDAAFQPLLAK